MLLNGNGKMLLTLTLLCMSIGANFTLLNGPQFLFTCSKFVMTRGWDYDGAISIKSAFPQCIPIETDESLALMTMWFYIGGFCGTLFVDLINFHQWVSPRWNLIIGQLLNISGGVLLGASSYPWQVGLGRVVFGFGNGIQYGTVPIYLTLLTQDLQCVSHGIITPWFNYTVIPLGVLLCQIISSPLLDSFHWRNIFWGQCLGQVILLYPLVCYVRESPKWYLVRGYSTDTVKDSLKQYLKSVTSRGDNTPQPYDSIVDRWNIEWGQHRQYLSEHINLPSNTNWLHKLKYVQHWSQYFDINHTGTITLVSIQLIIPLQLINLQVINQYGLKFFSDILSDDKAMSLVVLTSLVHVAVSLVHLVNKNQFWIQGSHRQTGPLYLNIYGLSLVGIMFIILFFTFSHNMVVVVIVSFLLLTVIETVIGMNKSFIAWTSSLHRNSGSDPNNIDHDTDDTDDTSMHRDVRLSRFCFWLGQVLTAYTTPLLFDLMGHAMFLWLSFVVILMNVVIKLYITM